jgi:hypothetical protein
MKCNEIIPLLPLYTTHSLPSQSARRVAFHLAVCKDCQWEYRVWRESHKVLGEGTSSLMLENRPSIADKVMSRIIVEERWSLPGSGRPVRLPRLAKRWITSVAVLFILVAGVMLFGAAQSNQLTHFNYTEWKKVPTTDFVMSADQLRVGKPHESQDLRYRIVASVGNTLDARPLPASPVHNIGLIAAIFGILVTVVGMSWLSRF